MRNELIKYRIEKSLQTLEDAIFNFENGKYATCLNRMYYSSFYAVTALLLCKDLYSKTHKGVKLLFNQYFVTTNFISNDFSKLYSRLFDLRQESDYEDFNEIDVSIIPELIEGTKSFISKINDLISEYFKTHE